MSAIDKLQILGVRSFSNQKAEIIQFYKPLTLIVGLNGSGKTTIIECLRYATTGELPPNSQTGGAWIHDPKLAGENEVLAQVKLSFSGADGSRMVATRSIQLTVKKNTRSQKALDSTLVRVRNGERIVMSSRVAQLDKLVPAPDVLYLDRDDNEVLANTDAKMNRYVPDNLGVSKAILESVIFCHQDDSLWPMQTPALLKKKFDEIFDAQKYTRAVDNIKLIKKNKTVDEKVLVEAEKGARRDKDRGVENQNKQEKLLEQIERLREQAEDLKLKMEDAQEKSTNAYDQAAQVKNIVVELHGKRNDANSTARRMNDLKQSMRELSDSDHDLHTMLEQYEDRLARNESDKDNFTAQYRTLSQEMESNRKALGKKQSEHGTLQAQKIRYEEQVVSRRELVKDTARRHNIRGFDTEIDDEKVREFMERIARLAREQQNAFEKARRETYEETQAAQQEMTKLNGRRSELAQTKTGANSYIQSNDNKIARHQSELNRIEVDEGSMTVVQSNLRDLESKLEKSKDDFATTNYGSKVQEAENGLQQLNAEKQKLERELAQASRFAQDTARLDLLHKDLKDRQQGLQTVQGAHGARISSILQRDWDVSTLDQVYQSVLGEKLAAVREAESLRDGKDRETELMKHKIAEAKRTVQTKEKELREHEETLQGLSELGNKGPADFLDVLDEAEDAASVGISDAAKSKVMHEFYLKCQKVLNNPKKNNCMLCRRGFDDADETDQEFRVAYAARLEEALQDAADATGAQILKQRQDKLQALKDARPHYDLWEALQKELPSLKKELKKYDTELQALNGHLEQRDLKVKEQEEAQREVEAISKTVQSIVKYHTDITHFDSQIKQLGSLSQNAGSRGLEKIQEDQEAINERLHTATTALQQLRANKERAQSDLTSLEFQVRDLKAQLNVTMTQLKEKTQLLSQIEDIKAHNTEQRNVIRNADHELQSLTPKIDQTQAKLDDIRARGDERDRNLQKQASKLADSNNQLKTAEQEINAYVDRGGPQQLARAEREITAINEELERIEGEQRQLATQIKRLEGELANHNETKRAIMDNLQYRDLVKTMQILEQEINELEGHNAEEDNARLEAEGKKWGDKRTRLAADQAQVVGELKSKDTQLNELMDEWKINFKEAHSEWRRKKVEMVVTKAAISDLDKYGKALDQAIMKYHSIKMDEINRIIDELWRNTYQGTDVDTIMIKSESESVAKNKSYNYRVVMKKQDAEMDMRGRCSAGQKVLASIIIRLALAECFGVRCGLIALDEPTTNLDRDNIISLAKSLSEIIRHRREQANFQLIVITHDEEFLKEMNCADYTDYYYRVGRDANMCSQIFKQNIQNVSATPMEGEWKITKFS